jgi:hypothetical protein
MQRGFLSPPGQSGSLSFYGRDGSRHQAIADHICAEVLTDKAEGKNGQIFWKWAKKPGAVNDWGDAMTGCISGATWFLGEIRQTKSGGKPVKKAVKRTPKVQIED